MHEDWRGFILQSTSIRKITAASYLRQIRKMDVRLEDTRRKHPGESQRCSYRESCRGNVDYRIPGIPHSIVQKEDSNRKETVKRLIQQFQNHPNRDSLIQDLNKLEEFNPFSEKSKEFISSMDNTEYFELCETSCKIQCLDCALNWKRALSTAHAASACSLQNGIDVPDMDHLCGSA